MLERIRSGAWKQGEINSQCVGVLIVSIHLHTYDTPHGGASRVRVVKRTELAATDLSLAGGVVFVL